MPAPRMTTTTRQLLTAGRMERRSRMGWQTAYRMGRMYRARGYTRMETVAAYYDLEPPEVRRLLPGVDPADMDALHEWDDLMEESAADTEADLPWYGHLLVGWAQGRPALPVLDGAVDAVDAAYSRLMSAQREAVG